MQQHSTDVPHPRHIEPRYLGTAIIQLGPQCFPKASFYEITESEISEQGLDRKHARSSSTNDTTVSPFQDQLSPLDDHEHLLADGSKLSTDCCSASETSCGRSDCAYLSLSESIAATTLIEKYVVEDDSSSMHSKSSVTLPPKKRKRRRILRQDIVFSFADHDEDELPSDADYYCFPKDALVETLADDPPFEVNIYIQCCCLLDPSSKQFSLFFLIFYHRLWCLYNYAEPCYRKTSWTQSVLDRSCYSMTDNLPFYPTLVIKTCPFPELRIVVLLILVINP